jgi:hypothetical protein
MRITINKPAIDILAGRAVNACERIGEAADKIGEAADAMTWRDRKGCRLQ